MIIMNSVLVFIAIIITLMVVNHQVNNDDNEF